MSNELNILLNEIRTCTYCTDFLPLGPNPVVEAHQGSKILIIGQMNEIFIIFAKLNDFKIIHA